MNNIKISSTITEFFKKIEPIFTFFTELDQSEVMHLIFAALCFLVTFGLWYWIFFKSGAQKSIEETVRWNEKLKLKTDPNRVIMRPLVSKIFISILLIGAVFFLFIAVIRVF